jgi:hypothetical protein
VGYELHVHRARDWSDAEEHPITLREWRGYVESAPDLRLEEAVEAESPDGARISLADEGGAAIWTGHPEGGDVWVVYRGGRIVVNGADRPVARRLAEVADALEARVQGDGGEFYGADGEPLRGEPAPGERPGLVRRLTGRGS